MADMQQLVDTLEKHRKQAYQDFLMFKSEWSERNRPIEAQYQDLKAEYFMAEQRFEKEQDRLRVDAALVRLAYDILPVEPWAIFALYDAGYLTVEGMRFSMTAKGWQRLAELEELVK